MRSRWILRGVCAAVIAASVVIVTLRIAAALSPGTRDLATEPADWSFYASSDLGFSGGTLPQGIGDINGDGRDDFVLGDSYGSGPDGTRYGSGVAYIYFGRATGPAAVDLTVDADVTIFGAAVVQRLGRDVLVKDVNDDGLGDVLIGSQTYSDAVSISDKGRLDIILGSQQLPPTIDLATVPADITLLGRDTFDDLSSGFNVGDVDGDGRMDLIVSARGANGPNDTRVLAGEAYIFLSAAALSSTIIDLSSATPSTIVYGSSTNQELSFAIATGDLNYDGIDDILFASPFEYNNNAGGDLRVLFGRVSWPAVIDLATTPADITIEVGPYGRWLGFAVVIADVTGDLRPDIVASDVLAQNAAGRVYVFDGTTLTSGIASDVADAVIDGSQSPAYLGSSLAVGNILGDERPELVVTGLDPDDGRPVAYVVDLVQPLPATATIQQEPIVARVLGKDVGDALNQARLGDFNGDGAADLFLRAYDGLAHVGGGYVILADTPTPTTTPTSTPTPTPTPVVGMAKVPEGSAAGGNVDLTVPKANLFICFTGPCSGPGEGDLVVVEHVSNIATGDSNGDMVQDGLGAYEFNVEYDNFVIQSVNPSDIVFSAGGAGASRGPANCSFSLVLENLVRFGCVTTGPTPNGPTGSFDLARLDLVPHPDLVNDLFPGNDNGVPTVIKDNGCELADVFGHPVLGSVSGGLLPACGDLAVTVRILEGDLNLDCKVDVTDEQLIGVHYASAFGSAYYSTWFDLEPRQHDLDIDIKDLQKVFGRDGSTCQQPIPQQTPVDPPAPFGG